MILASVVLPDPGGPQKMHEPRSPRRIRSPNALPGPRSCSWPRNWSRFLGRILAAKGSVEPWNRVGSDTWGPLKTHSHDTPFRIILVKKNTAAPAKNAEIGRASCRERVESGDGEVTVMTKYK